MSTILILFKIDTIQHNEKMKLCNLFCCYWQIVFEIYNIPFGVQLLWFIWRNEVPMNLDSLPIWIPIWKSHHISLTFSGTDNIKTSTQSDLIKLKIFLRWVGCGTVWIIWCKSVTSSCLSVPVADSISHSIHEHLLVNVLGIRTVAISSSVRTLRVSIDSTSCFLTISVSYSVPHAIVPIIVSILPWDTLKSKVQNLTLDSGKQAWGDLFFRVHS